MLVALNAQFLGNFNSSHSTFSPVFCLLLSVRAHVMVWCSLPVGQGLRGRMQSPDRCTSMSRETLTHPNKLPRMKRNSPACFYSIHWSTPGLDGRDLCVPGSPACESHACSMSLGINQWTWDHLIWKVLCQNTGHLPASKCSNLICGHVCQWLPEASKHLAITNALFLSWRAFPEMRNHSTLEASLKWSTHTGTWAGSSQALTCMDFQMSLGLLIDTRWSLLLFNPLQIQKSANEQDFLQFFKIARNFFHTIFFGNEIHCHNLWWLCC